jgi:hypothetical protein
MLKLLKFRYALLVIAVLVLTKMHTSDARLHNTPKNFDEQLDDKYKNRKNKNDIVVTRIEPIDEQHERRLLTCNDYQYKVRILDNLFMYYVAHADTQSISIKLEYLGTAWISLGIDKSGRGAMTGSEAWLALPDAAVSGSNPGVYSMKSKSVSGVVLSTRQMLQNGTVEQVDGITSTSFTRTYTDFFLINQPISNTSSNEFVWAYGTSNAYTSRVHKRAGSFSLQIEECLTPNAEIKEINQVKDCGLFKLNIFCPATQCGIVGRLIGLC